MSAHQLKAITASCRCGAVALEVTGPPIARAVCYCLSCQEAGRRIEQTAGAPPVLDADGGTDVVLYRKDRVRCVSGGDLLQVHRLKPDSPTRRMVASCCGSAMALDFAKGHWLTVYSGRLPGPLAPPDMRVMTAHRRSETAPPPDAPSYRGYSGKFMGRVLGAWIQMGFRTPKVEGMPA